MNIRNTYRTLKETFLSVDVMAILLCVFGAVPAVNAASLALYPQSPFVTVGGVAMMDVVISDLGAGVSPSLSGFDMTLRFDPNVVQLSAVVFGAAGGDELDLGGYGSVTYFDTSIEGEVLFGELSFDDPGTLNDYQSGTFTIASIEFNVVAAGVAEFTLDNETLLDAFGDAIALDSINRTASVVASATAVPLPAAAGLFVAGFGSLLFAARRKAR